MAKKDKKGEWDIGYTETAYWMHYLFYFILWYVWLRDISSQKSITNTVSIDEWRGTVQTQTKETLWSRNRQNPKHQNDSRNTSHECKLLR
jgi:hypothetical protein